MGFFFFTLDRLKLKQHQQKLNFFLSRAISKVPDLQFKVSQIGHTDDKQFME